MADDRNRELIQRATHLAGQYRTCVDSIAETMQTVKRDFADLEAKIAAPEFDMKEAKRSLQELNTSQTKLVLTLKKMSEAHAKMGYLIK